MSTQQILLREEVVQNLGEQLKSARESAHESIDAVAERLLISKHQVIALETGKVTAFYSPRHFVQMARKYCAHLNTPCPENLIAEGALLVGDLASQIETTPPVTNAQTRSEAPEPLVAIEPPKKQETPKAVVVASATKPALMRPGIILVIAVIAAGAWWYITHQEQGDNIQTFNTAPTTGASVETSNIPATQTTNPSEQAAPLEKEPSTSSPTVPVPTAQPEAEKYPIKLEISNLCWIQLNYADGRKIEKIYPAKTLLEFKQAELTGMVIGNLNAASLTIHGKPVSLQPYQKPDSNVARFLGKDAEEALGK